MNDRFKFRVWNVLKQEFEPENRTHLLGNGELVLIDKWGKTYVKDDPNYKVSFCTGLKDKNGKPIYENDIIFNNCGQFIIKFCDKCKSFQCFDDKYGCYSCLGDYMWADFLEDLERTEVIGNIYENPDMLEQN